jgi:hypothetical protein
MGRFLTLATLQVVLSGGAKRPGVSKEFFGHYLPLWNYYHDRDEYRPNLFLLR